MRDDDRSSITKVGSTSIYPLFAPFPVAFFAGALVTDLVYWRAPDAMWDTFSIWLITAGLVMGGLSILAGLIDLVGQRRNPARMPVWPRVLATAVAFALAFINAFVHSRDGYTAVVPTGLILSGLVVVILLCTAWMGRELVYRHRVGEVS
jgi:uncharacterized membrane protein